MSLRQLRLQYMTGFRPRAARETRRWEWVPKSRDFRVVVRPGERPEYLTDVKTMTWTCFQDQAAKFTWERLKAVSVHRPELLANDLHWRVV